MSHIQKRPNGRYKVRWIDPESGQERSKICASRGEAKAFQAKVDASLLDGTYVDAARERTPLREYVEVWSSGRHYRSGRARIVDNALRVHIVPVLGGRPLGDISRATVQDFVNSLSRDKGLKPGTITNILEVLTRVLRDAVEDRYLTRCPVPARGQSSPIVIPGKGDSIEQFLRPEEVKSLIAAADSKFRPLVLLLAGSGLRIGEALGLTVGAIDLEAGVIRVDQQRTQDGQIRPPKTGQRRVVPLSIGLERVLKPLMAGRDAADPLWLNDRGGPLLYQAFMDRWHKMLDAAGLDWSPTPHAMRHFYASHMLEQGIPVTKVSRALGHANATKTLSVYAHAIREDLDDVRGAFGNQFWADGPLTA